MPRIPDSFQPSVSLQAAPTPQVQAPGITPVNNATGGQLEALGQGLKQFGFGVSAMEDRYDESMAKNNAALVTDQVTKHFYAPDGFLNKIGQDASKEKMDEAFASLEADIKHIGGSMTASQRAMWEPDANRQLQRARIAAYSHHEQETRVQAIGAAQNRATSASQQALRAHKAKDYNEVTVQIGVIGIEGDATAKEKGWDLSTKDGKLARDQWVLERTTKTHADIVLGMVDQDPKGARAWLTANEKQIDPESVAKLQGIVKNGETKDAALQFSFDAIRASALAIKDGTPSDYRTYSLAAADKAFLDKKIDATEYHMARQNIQTHYADQASLKGERDVEMRTQFQKWLLDDPSRNPNDNAALKTWAQANGEWDDIVAFHNNRDTATDPGTIEYLRSTPIEELVNLYGKRRDFEAKFGKLLSKRDLKSYLDAMAVQIGDATKEQQGAVSRDKRAEQLARDLGILKDKMSFEEETKYGRWKIDFMDSTAGMTPEQYKKQVKATTEDFVEMDGAKVPFATLSEKDIRENGADITVDLPGFGKVSLTDVGEERIKQITAGLKRQGHPVTGQNIVRVYGAAVLNGQLPNPRAVPAKAAKAVSQSSDTSLGQTPADLDTAWDAEFRRRIDAYGERGWRSKLMTRGAQISLEKAMFESSEAARRENARLSPRDPQFFYENWHKLDSSLTNGPVSDRESASRENPYMDPQYKSKVLNRTEMDAILNGTFKK